MNIEGGMTGLCNQLCIFINAIEEAYRILTMGIGVIYKQNIDKLVYGGKLVSLSKLPLGYHRIDNDFIGDDPLPTQHKVLEIFWIKNYSYKTSVYHELEWIHCLDSIPDKIQLKIGNFYPHCDSNDFVPLETIIDINNMNKFLLPFRIELITHDIHLNNSIQIMKCPNIPRNSAMFQILVSNCIRY